MPRAEAGFRIHLTAANTGAQVDRLNAVLGELSECFRRVPAGRPARWAPRTTPEPAR